MAIRRYERFVVKRDTAANFTAANTLLLDGEFGLETDTGLKKMGNGVTPWNSLAYINSDLTPEGATNLYHTAARVRDTILTGLSTATNAVIAATDSVLVALGKLQSQISGLITQTITNGDTTHAPSGDAVFDALALKSSRSAVETFAGQKTLAPGGGGFPSIDAKWHSVIVGDRPQADGRASILMNPLGVLGGVSLTFNSASDSLQLYDWGSTGVPVRLEIGRTTGHVLPGADNTQNLGSAARQWSELCAGKVTASGTIKSGSYTVATLPAGASGLRAFVTDASAPSWGTSVVGGGAVQVPVFYNIAWKVG